MKQPPDSHTPFPPPTPGHSFDKNTHYATINTKEWLASLVQHRLWWRTGGTRGRKLQLHSVDLRKMPFDPDTTCLAGANLQQCDMRGVVLKGINLSMASLCGTLLTNADLRRTRFSKTDLTDVHLQQARLERAHMAEARLHNADMTRADLTFAELAGAQCHKAKMDSIQGFKAKLVGADLSHASLCHANLVQATLRSADLSHAQMEHCFLGGADLRGARLSYTCCNNARMQEVKLEGTTLREVDLSDVQGHKLKAQGTAFHHVVMRGIDLTSAQLQETLFSYVELAGASLEKASLEHSQWRHVTCHHMRLEGASLVGARADEETVSRSGWHKQQIERWLDRGGSIIAENHATTHSQNTPPQEHIPAPPDFFPTGGGKLRMPATQPMSMLHPSHTQHGADALPTRRPKALREGMLLQERYRIEQRIGRGGMGEVFLCTDLQNNRLLAVKLLHASLSHHPELLRRFAQEIALSENMDHNGLVKCANLQRDEDSGRIFFTMPYLRGETLAMRLHKQPDGTSMPRHEVIRLLDVLAEILDYAHEQGVIHRDVKPSNVMLLTNGQIKLMDFGIARHANSATTAHEHDSGPGTIFYTAPEQLRGNARITPAADIFSLGVMAYQMLTGDIPVGIPQRPSEYDPTLPPQTDDVIFRAMAAKPQRRHPSCAIFAAELRSTLLS